MDSLDVFAQHESQVRSYSRAFPALFTTAEGGYLYDEHGRGYLDFFVGAGVMSYGHNNPHITQALISHLQNNGIIHSLDLATHAKKAFIQSFHELILHPRGLPYKLQFTGPTGANAVEAALKLARRVTGRANVISFTNGYHGLSMGALAHTGEKGHRHPSYFHKLDATVMPFDGYLGQRWTPSPTCAAS
jgi:diaminobutyrate-2-oxoglutarate transaminase